MDRAREIPHWTRSMDTPHDLYGLGPAKIEVFWHHSRKPKRPPKTESQQRVTNPQSAVERERERGERGGLSAVGGIFEVYI